MSQVYISEPNKHIEDYFDYYFDGKKNFEYAVLLNGAWGSGKTWFVKKYLNKKESQGKKICYISLNGLSKTSDIDEAIFKSIHPILSSKGAKLLDQILKSGIKLTTRIDVDTDGKSDGSISSSIPKVELPDYLKIDDNFILAFDDLERCKLKIEETLGYINYFVEQENIKTLIISNETEIQENESFLTIKEKLIGTTFNYTEDQNLAIKSILEEVSNGELKERLVKTIDLITQTFNQVGYKNLRSFKQAIFDFERFYRKKYFEWNEIFDNEIFGKILKSFLILSLENKKGYFEKAILEFKKDKIVDDEKKIDTKTDILKSLRGISSTDSEKFMNKYNCSLNNFIFSSNLWNEILNLNIIEVSKIEAELYEKYFRLKEDPPTWLKLMDFWDLEESSFDSLITKAKFEIENNTLTHPSDVLHVISMLIYFKENKLIYFSIDPLLPIAKDHWKKLIDLNEKMVEIRDLSFTEYSGSYGFYAKGIKKFDEFIKNVMTSYKDKYIEKNSERAKKLLDLMETNAELFVQRIILNNSVENFYYNFPILNAIDPKEFAEKLCNINHHNSKRILYGLFNRYTIKASFNMYTQEKLWLDRVENSIKTNTLPSANKILKARINLQILPEILEIKEAVKE